MGYVTPGSSNLFGKAAFRYFQQAEAAKDLPKLRLVLEGAAGIPYTRLQDRDRLLHQRPEELRTLLLRPSHPSTVIPRNKSWCSPCRQTCGRAGLRSPPDAGSA
jgi:hypothetical protein